MKVILKQKEWVAFLKANEEIFISAWDLLPKQMNVRSVEEIVWSGQKIYDLEYSGKVWLAWEGEIEELVM